MDDEHARVGVVLGDDVGEVARALLGGGPGAEALADRIDVVVDGLGQADDGEVVVVSLEEGGEIGGGGVGVVAADGVEHVHAVLDELVGGDFLRVLAFLDEAALDAVLDVGELHAAVADRAAAVVVEDLGVFADGGGNGKAVAQQQALVAAAVADDLDGGIDLGVALDERADGAGETRGEAPGGENGDFFRFHGGGWRGNPGFP